MKRLVCSSNDTVFQMFCSQSRWQRAVRARGAPLQVGRVVKGPGKFYPDFEDIKLQALEKQYVPPSLLSISFSIFRCLICNGSQCSGLYLDLETLGPLYKVRCHLGDTSGVLLGESDGFIIPFARLMHCDTMRIYNSKLKGVQRSMDLQLGFMGLGKVLAKAVLTYGYSKGCLRAEILAINDEEDTHRKLVMYYKRLGFRSVREVVGDSLSDVPHMLVWGGAGTRMDASIPDFLESLLER